MGITIYETVKRVVRHKSPYENQVTIRFENGMVLTIFDENKVIKCEEEKDDE